MRPTASRVVSGVFLGTAAMALIALPIHGRLELAAEGSARVIAPPPPLAGVRSALAAEVRAGNAISLVVAVAQRGRVVWDEAFGWADREGRIAATPDTVYPIASLSKALTATGVFLLVERGQVKTGDPVQRYLGSVRLRVFRTQEAAPTVSDILDMTGGIPHYWQYFWEPAAAPPPTTAELLQRYGIVAFPPGRYFHYSNLSYAVAEQLIAQVSGTSFADFMRQRLLLPLGMTRTSLQIGPEPGNAVAVAYGLKARRWPRFDFYPKGGAGFYSTANDLLRFGQFHLHAQLAGGRKILAAPTIDSIHRLPPAHGAGRDYANGWGILEIGETKPALLADGEILGAAATLLLLPSRDVAIVCMTNQNTKPRYSDAAAFKIADALIPGFARKLEELEAKADREDEVSMPLTPLAGDWDGEVQTYQGALPVAMAIQEDGGISVRLGNEAAAALERGHFNGSTLQGSLAGRLPAADTQALPHRLEIELFVDKQEMMGTARAVSQGDTPGFGLPSYLALRKRQP
ncbi:MAG TPA: serine hydrolase domain-containing protein [Thermoanaerobaculia bacterium]|nr:serine hydrolase domain-containing protein [Thermoanaerobaculia bacterium]